MVPAGQSFVGAVSINDPVNCQGALIASGGTICLNGGLMLSGTGTIQLGSGNLTTNDALSTISGGWLSDANHFVGNGGTGIFTQTGGTNSVSALVLGNNAGDSGTYNLSGSGLLSAHGRVHRTVRQRQLHAVGRNQCVYHICTLETTPAAAERIT